jgi:hypothetical protein
MMSQSRNTQGDREREAGRQPKGPVSQFDYTNQAWVVNGRYVRCGHPDWMPCGCFGRSHVGELVKVGVELQ